MLGRLPARMTTGTGRAVVSRARLIAVTFCGLTLCYNHPSPPVARVLNGIEVFCIGPGS